MSQNRVARGRRRSGHVRLRRCLLALFVGRDPGAGGGFGERLLGRVITQFQRRHDSQPGKSAAPQTSSRAVATGPLSGRAMWIWYVSASNGGKLTSIIGAAHRYGVSVVIVKSADGPTAWPQFNPQLVSTLHANGLRVCAWQYVYGNHPIYEAQVGAAAATDGADCLVIDAESEYEGKYVQAQTYITQLRKLVGARYPVALAGFPYVDYHPAFPYSVFLGPGGAEYNTPQMYWLDIGTTVDAVYAHTYAFNRMYQRQIDPLGQVWETRPRARSSASAHSPGRMAPPASAGGIGRRPAPEGGARSRGRHRHPPASRQAVSRRRSAPRVGRATSSSGLQEAPTCRPATR